MMHWPEGDWHMGGMWLWWLVALALLLVIVRLLLRHSGRDVVAPESAEQTLRRRYAIGEIDTEEYERRLASLRK